MRFYNQPHRFYCGVDLHARTRSLCSLDADGTAAFHDTIAASPAAFLKAVKPFRAFMLKQTRREDIQTFVRMSHGAPATLNDVPMVTLTSAFVISELRTAFQIGFALFLPFIVIDVAVSSVLMSMGMFMLPPAMISLPFKLLLFVMVDGWNLLISSLVRSFA